MSSGTAISPSGRSSIRCLPYGSSAWNSIFANNRFRLRNFLKQVAVGTGIGLRYDLDFLVLRVDWGLGLHLPYETDHGGYFNIRRFRDMSTIHFAIGYPF